MCTQKNKKQTAQAHISASSSAPCHSSSSSSLASSNDDDPANELLRLEKRKKRDLKELDTFIGHLDATLNAANLLRCDSEIEDIKDEMLEDLEEEAIQAETAFGGRETGQFGAADGGGFSCERDEEGGSLSSRTIRNNEDLENMTIGHLGATNHMHNRINQLEK